MLDQEAIAHQQEVLSTYRRTLAHLLRQAAQFGGEAFAPPHIANGIHEARAQIQWIKATLHDQGLSIADEPGDTALAAAASPIQMTQALRNRTRLLQKVRAFWVEGVLHTSFHGIKPLVLRMEIRPNSVAQPWDMLIPYLGQEVRALPDGTSIVEVYNKCGGELLILGDPGSGKTITMLELTRALLDRADADPGHPLPVVLHLGSWNAQQHSLQDWIIDELNQRYDVPRGLGRPWVDTDQILPLLDGLDEVPGARRELCVAAINQFRQDHGLVGIAICCRTHDYDALPVRLKVQGAVHLQPLTPLQVDAYVAQGGPQFASIQRVLQDDMAVWELARMPLLLNIMRLAYQGMAVEYLPALDSIELRRAHLFALYIQRMLDRSSRQPSELLYTQEQTLRWLTWTAQMMQQYNQPIFLIERLQPDCLQTRAQRWLYLVLVGLVVAFVVGLLGGMIGSIRAEWTTALIIALASAIPLIRGITRIEPFEAFHWSWPQVLKGLGVGLTVGASLGVVGWQYGAWAGSLILGLGTGIFGGLIAGIIFGLRSRTVAIRTTPNEGIWRSGRNALRIWLAIGASFGVGLGLLGLGVDRSFGVQSLPTWYWLLNFGLPFGFIFCAPSLALACGGLVWIQHFLLRFVLWCSGAIPWNYIGFLDYCVEHVLLQRVGGGYIFIHQLLLEYFAVLDTTEQDGDTHRPPVQQERTVGT